LQDFACKELSLLSAVFRHPNYIAVVFGLAYFSAVGSGHFEKVRSGFSERPVIYSIQQKKEGVKKMIINEIFHEVFINKNFVEIEKPLILEWLWN